MNLLKKYGKIFLNILYPRRCPVCHDIAVPKGHKICEGCRQKLKPIEGPRCFRCSKPLEAEEQEFCRNCQRKTHHYDQGIGIFTYGSLLQQSLIKLKYEKRQEYGLFYGEFAAFYAREKILHWKIDMVVPIPLHWKRMEKRGYNQAEIIAGALGKKLNLPVNAKILKRKRNTRPQKDLNEAQRKENLAQAFAVCKNVQDMTILLVDDIYTTGATVDAAARVLKAAGAKKVYFISIAIGTDG